MLNETVGTVTSIRIERFRNQGVIDWISGSFRTELEKSAAGAMFAYICNEYPEAGKLLRGELIDVEETIGE